MIIVTIVQRKKTKKINVFSISLVVFISILVASVTYFGFRKGRKKFHESTQNKNDIEEVAILPKKRKKRYRYNMEKIKVWNKKKGEQPVRLDVSKSDGEDVVVHHEVKTNINTNTAVHHFVMHSMEQNGLEVIEMNVSGCTTVPLVEDESSIVSSSSEVDEEDEGDLLLHNSPMCTPPKSMKQSNQNFLFPGLVSGYEVAMDVDDDDTSNDSFQKSQII